MKLFVFCLGAALAATAVSADTPVDPEQSSNFEVEYGSCYGEEIYVSDTTCMGDTCEPEEGYDNVVCCGYENTNIDVCHILRQNCWRMDNLATNLGCGYCISYNDDVPEDTGSCCHKSCCNYHDDNPELKSSDLETLTGQVGFELSVSSEEVLLAWLTRDLTSDLDIFISKEVRICGEFMDHFAYIPKGVSLLTPTIKKHLRCAELCCPCCYNVEVIETEAPVAAARADGNTNMATGLACCDESLDCDFTEDTTYLYSLGNLNERSRTNYHQSTSYVCLTVDYETWDFNGDDIMLVVDGAFINTKDVLPSDDKTYEPHRSYHVHCNKKVDGGNSGYCHGNHNCGHDKDGDA